MATRAVWLLLLSFGVIGVLSQSACEEDGEDVVVNATLEDENVAPSIVLVGPDYPGATTQTYFSLSGWYVLVADGNGLEDISAVFLDIGSIDLNGIIARPDLSTSPPDFCDHAPSFVDNDTLDIDSALPASFPGIDNVPMYHSTGGLYETPGLLVTDADFCFDCPVLLQLDKASPTFSPTELTCAQDELFDLFRVNPPTLPAPTETFIAQVDVTLRNITVTVYDSEGARATADVPDLRVIYLTRDEERALP
jgi:hypothetical protein